MKLFYVVFLIVWQITANAQHHTDKVRSGFVADSVQLDISKVLQTSLKLKNNTENTVALNIRLTSSSTALQLSGSLLRVITLKANEQLYLPIAAIYYGDGGDVPTIQAAVTIEDQQQAVHQLTVLPAKFRNIQLILPSKNIDYGAADSHITIPIKIQNTGTTHEKLNLIVRWPEHFNNTQPALTVDLKPGTDTLVTATYPINRLVLKHGTQQAVVSLYYSNNDYIRSETVSLASVRNQHTYSKPIDVSSDNRIGIGTQYMSYTKEATYRTVLKQDIALSASSTLSIDANAEYWSRTGDFFLRNTNLHYTTKDFGITAGSIFQSGELTSNGRGIMGHYSVNDSLKLLAGWIDKSYTLTDNFTDSRGTSLWLGVAENQAQTTATTFYADSDRFSDVNKYLLYHTHEVTNKKNLKVNYSQGLSVLMAPNTTPYTGILADLSSYYRLGNFSWFGTHQVSSPHYAGIRRGMMLFQQKINYTIKNNSIDLTYNYYRLKPKAVNAFEFFGIESKNSIAAINYRHHAHQWIYGVGSSYLKDRQDFVSFNSAQKLESARLNLQAQYRFAEDRGMIGTITSMGKLLESQVSDPLTFRSEWTVQYANVRLSANYQYNYYNIYETLFSNPDKNIYQNIGVYLSGTHLLYNNAVKFNWSINYSENPQYTGLQWSSRINWNLAKGWEVHGGYYSNATMHLITNQSYQIELGMVKRLDTPKIYEKNHKITIQLLYNEGNGSLVPAVNRKLWVNGYAFETDGLGTARFLKAPEGTYTLRAQNDESWMAAEEQLYINTDVTHTMVLNKTTAIKGAILWNTSTDAYDVDKGTTLFIIKATNSTGKEYRTFTDANGNYALFVPEDQYKLTATPQKQSVYLEVTQPTITVKTASEPVRIDFEVLIKSRQVETRKFNSVKF